MKKDVIISISFHLVIILSILLFGPRIQPAKGYPRVYRVGLVSLPPAGGGENGKGLNAETSTKAQDGSKPGISIKEEKKSKDKKSSKEENSNKNSSEKKNKSVSTKQEDKTKGSQKGNSSKEGLASSGVNGGIIGSAQTDGADFGGDYYVQMFVAKINNLWENPIKNATSTLSATIYFRIMKNGNITDARIEKSSGTDVFDRVALRAVISANPLQPLPDEYTGEYLGVHLEFEFAQ